LIASCRYTLNPKEREAREGGEIEREREKTLDSRLDMQAAIH
jgi:hypothetical protein